MREYRCPESVPDFSNGGRPTPEKYPAASPCAMKVCSLRQESAIADTTKSPAKRCAPTRSHSRANRMPSTAATAACPSCCPLPRNRPGSIPIRPSRRMHGCSPPCRGQGWQRRPSIRNFSKNRLPPPIHRIPANRPNPDEPQRPQLSEVLCDRKTRTGLGFGTRISDRPEQHLALRPRGCRRDAPIRPNPVKNGFHSKNRRQNAYFRIIFFIFKARNLKKTI